MDRHGLLRVLHRTNTVCLDVQRRRAANTYEWQWDCTAVMFPESLCTFCHKSIQSSLIWLLKGPEQKQIVGQLYFEPGGKVKLLHISHAHMLTTNTLCIGNHPNGVELLGSPVNLRGTSMTQYYVPRWYKRYWNHDCLEMRDYIRTHSDLEGRPSAVSTLLRELDAPWSISSASEA